MISKFSHITGEPLGLMPRRSDFATMPEAFYIMRTLTRNRSTCCSRSAACPVSDRAVVKFADWQQLAIASRRACAMCEIDATAITAATPAAVNIACRWDG